MGANGVTGHGISGGGHSAVAKRVNDVMQITKQTVKIRDPATISSATDAFPWEQGCSRTAIIETSIAGNGLHPGDWLSQHETSYLRLWY